MGTDVFDFSGFGGTNAHVILESFESPPGPTPATMPLIIPYVFSASSKSSLMNLLRRYLNFCQRNPGVNSRDLAWTLHKRRSLLPYRVAIPASSITDLSGKLEDLLVSTSNSTSALSQRCFDKPHAHVWGIFTGQGAQWPRMGAALVKASDLARGYISHLDEILANLPDCDRPSWTLYDELLAEPHESRVFEASVGQPLCTAIQIVLVNLLRFAGVTLHCVIGHSSGEIGAAYASGLISEDEAIRAAYYRGKVAALAQEDKGGKRGAMLAVSTTLEDVEALSELEMFYGRVQMAAHNSPSTVVLSGDEEAIDEVAGFFQSRRVLAQKVKVDTAYHSHHMLLCAEQYAAALEGLKVEAPSDSHPVWYSSTKPSVKMTSQNLTSRYWAENMTDPVRFFEAVAHALDNEGAPELVLEFGPHPALSSAFANSFKNITGMQKTPPYHGLLSRGHDDIQQLSSALGDILRHLGVGSVDFDALDQVFSGNTERKRMITGLPQYPFDHTRSFGDLSRVSSAHIHGHSAPHVLLGRRCFELETTHEVTWRNILNPMEISWLFGHRLQGQLVFPATAFLAMAVESIMLLLADKTPNLVTIEDMIVERAIVFGDDEAGIETLFTVKFDSSNPAELTAEFSCYSSLSNDAPMVRNVCGRIMAELEDHDRGSLPDMPRETYNLREVTADRFYTSLAKLGYEYQSPFNGIRSIKRKLGYATGTIHDKPGSKWEEDQLFVHPGMMDSALQTICAASSCPGDGLTYTMKVPTRIDRLVIDHRHASVLRRSKEREFVNYTSLVQETFRGETIADVYLSTQYSPAETFIQIEGVHIKPLSPSSPEDDEVIFSDFVYGPYELDARLAASMSMGESDVARPDDQSIARVWVAKLAIQLAHRYPRMHVLEIGKQASILLPLLPETKSFRTELRIVAGSRRGKETQEIFPILDSAFSSYTFTDTSHDVCSEMKDKWRDFAGRMVFKPFDAQTSFIEHGFAERFFDLIIAANVTSDLDSGAVETTLQNLRQLLKPGGTLLLSVPIDTETGGDDPTANCMALSHWNTCLQSRGFSGINTLMPKPHDVYPYVVFETLAVDEHISILRNPLQHTEKPVAGFEILTIIGGKTCRSQKLVEELTTLLRPKCRQLENIDSVEQLLVDDHDLMPAGFSVLCVTDLDEPILKDFTVDKLEALKLLFQKARNVLWVCQGARKDEPYSAMMFGLSRTIRAEYSNLNLQMLDVDTFDKDTASRIASILLRLQIRDSWAREGSRDDMVWSVERELVVEQGRILIPRLRPKKSSNLRYHTARRRVSLEVDPQKVSIQLSYGRCSSSSSTSLAIPTLQEIPKLQIPAYPLSPKTTVRITHSLFPFIRIDGVGPVMLCAGMDTSADAPVFALSSSAASPAPAIKAWTVQQSDLKIGPAGGLNLIASSLVAQQILACTSTTGTLVVHNAGAALAQALRRGANTRGVSLLLTSSTRNDVLGERVLYIHPKSSKSFISRMIPRSTSKFVDLSTTEIDGDYRNISSVLRSFLPQDCDILQRSRFYSTEVQTMHQESITQQSKSILQIAVEEVANLTSTTPIRDSIVIPLSKMATTVNFTPVPVVLDWTEASTSIDLLAIDEGVIFRTDKTYVLVGLAGELGQSLAEWMVHHGARNIVLSSRRPVVDPKFVESLSKEWGAVVDIMALLVFFLPPFHS